MKNNFCLKDTITIDVGKNGTALSFWFGTIHPRTVCFQCHKKYSKTIESTLNYMDFTFREILEDTKKYFTTKKINFSSNKAILEGVHFREDSKGLQSARRGDVFNLAYLVGIYFNILNSLNIDTKIILASQWKGTLDKNATRTRVHAINGRYYLNDHITDAVGMGLSQDKDLWKLIKRVR